MQYDLLLQNISGITDTKWINLENRLGAHEQSVTTYPPFWRLYNNKLKGITLNWDSLKFSSNVNPAVAAGTPGIYLFVLNPSPTIFDLYKIIMYVGMSDDGLNERLNKGYRTPSGIKARPAIHRMILQYGRFLDWYYAPLPGLSEPQLRAVETNLLGFFNMPPVNKKDAPTIIANAKKSKFA